MKRILAVALCALILTLPACQSLFTDEQQQILTSRINELEAQQAITKTEADIAREFVTKDVGDQETWENILWAAGSILGALIGVNIQRGSPTNRKGLPPKGDAA